MREILFRGKRLGTGEWVEGACFPASGPYPATIFHGKHNALGEYVEAETVGQFTGLTDRNGKRIFDGDVVSTGKEQRVVRFRNGAFELLRRASAVAMYDLVGTDVEYEVIGTIHDKEKQNEGK